MFSALLLLRANAQDEDTEEAPKPNFIPPPQVPDSEEQRRQ